MNIKNNGYHSQVLCGVGVFGAEYLLQVAPPEPETTNDKAHNVSGVHQGDGYRPAKIGKTGVELRYYKRKEFMKFSEAQKTELKEWRAQRENRGKKRGRDEAGEERRTGHEADARVATTARACAWCAACHLAPRASGLGMFGPVAHRRNRTRQ